MSLSLYVVTNAVFLLVSYFTYKHKKEKFGLYIRKMVVLEQLDSGRN